MKLSPMMGYYRAEKPARGLLSILVSLMLLASCSTSTDVDKELSPAEVSGLLDVLVNESLFGGEGQPWPCSAGGDVSTFTYDDSGAGYLSRESRPFFNACRGTSDSGLDFTIDGPGEISEKFFVSAFGRFEGGRESSLSGTIPWRLGDRTGSCTVDLELVLTDGVYTSVHGTACGMMLDQPIASLTITTTTLPSGTVGQAYSQSFAATGGDGFTAGLLLAAQELCQPDWAYPLPA